MYKCLFLFLFFVAAQISPSFAQNQKGKFENNASTHDYYIYISGVNARADVENLENSIQKKTGVTYFLGYRYPVKYFLLKSNIPVSLAEFSTWIDLNRYKVAYYGEGIMSKEKAIITGKKINKIQ